ncbi:MAG: nitrophenyl compound nitroreductase subunit ArsF family protein [Bacteroidales bacterium]|nr:nitrophenyl compound nitroreductase subunit ArsF family protein [Bacteroidales bacterium]MDZ4204228.1 nitrophenyl compound nitroreductase subunit ArsF family protein [Bacteroidales bacterium]
MRTLTIFIVAILFAAACGQLNQRNTDTKTEGQTIDNAKVMVYYFHGKQRCTTCLAVQKVAEETFTKFFSDIDDVRFREVDISKKENEALAEKYEIYFSSLIIATTDSFEDITDVAFASAVNNPLTLQELMVKVINEFLEK